VKAEVFEIMESEENRTGIFMRGCW